MTGAEKAAFLRRMAKGKAAARRKNPARSANPRKRRTTRRRKNPMKVGGIDVKPLAVQGLGVAVGAYFGGAITSMLNDNILSRLPAGFARALGWASVGVGSLVLGEYLGKRVEDLPVQGAMAGASVPMWLEAFRAINWLPTSDTSVSSTTAGRRRMRGTIRPGMIPGAGMAGTIQPGYLPGAMMGMGKSRFGALLS